MHKRVSASEKAGKWIGYVLMFFIFVTVLYFVLTLTHKLPAGGGYPLVLLGCIELTIIGRCLKIITK